MKKYEYLIKHTRRDDELPIADMFNNLGENGWKLCAVVNMNNDHWIYFYFRRPLPGFFKRLFGFRY